MTNISQIQVGGKIVLITIKKLPNNVVKIIVETFQTQGDLASGNEFDVGFWEGPAEQGGKMLLDMFANGTAMLMTQK